MCCVSDASISIYIMNTLNIFLSLEEKKTKTKLSVFFFKLLIRTIFLLSVYASTLGLLRILMYNLSILSSAQVGKDEL